MTNGLICFLLILREMRGWIRKTNQGQRKTARLYKGKHSFLDIIYKHKIFSIDLR